MKDFEELVEEAISLCSEYERVSPYLFQRTLGIDLTTAENVFIELKKLEIITNVRRQEDDINAFIADVDKKKIQEGQVN